MDEQELTALYEEWSQSVDYDHRHDGGDSPFWRGAGSFLHFLIEKVDGK